jgi:hypothetical protein
MAWHISKPFPVEALGRVLSAAVCQHHMNTRVSTDMIAMFALGCSAGLVQDRVNVRRPNLAPSSSSLYIAVIASTGEGKDTAIGPFVKPFNIVQADAEREGKELASTGHADAVEWKLVDKALVQELAKVLAAGEPAFAIKKKIAAHQRSAPAIPAVPSILYEDSSPSGAKRGLCKWRSAVLADIDADNFFNRHMATDFAFINKGWQGSAMFIDRAREPRRSVPEPRLGLVLGVQAVPFMRFLKRRGVEAHDSGFTARFLAGAPPSTAGLRMISGLAQPTDLVDAFVARGIDLLEESIAATRAGKPRRVLGFAPDAEWEFVRLYNRVQELMQWGNLLFDIRGFASKAAENIARIAAILHVIDDLEGDISIDTLRRATCIVEWFTGQFHYIYTQAGVQPSIEHDAELLLRGIAQACLDQGGRLRRSHLQYLVGDLPPARARHALNLLVSQRRVVVGAEGRADVLSVPGMVLPQIPA